MFFWCNNYCSSLQPPPLPLLLQTVLTIDGGRQREWHHMCLGHCGDVRIWIVCGTNGRLPHLNALQPNVLQMIGRGVTKVPSKVEGNGRGNAVVYRRATTINWWRNPPGSSLAGKVNQTTWVDMVSEALEMSTSDWRAVREEQKQCDNSRAMGFVIFAASQRAHKKLLTNPLMRKVRYTFKRSGHEWTT